MKLHRALTPLLLCLLAAAFAAPVSAADSDWRVKNRLQGKLKDGKPGKSEDVSGIACAPGSLPRLCLVVDDETQGAQVVILQQDLLIAGDFIPLIDDVHDGKPLELDAEGVAYADGFFYVAGSQGRARHEEDAAKEAKNLVKAAATRKVFRIALGPDGVDLATGALAGEPAVTTSTALAELLAKDPVLAAAFDRPLEKNGLTVEGVAVKGDQLYAAMRGPVLDDGSAVIARVPLAALFDGVAGEATLFRLALDQDTQGDSRGIRDLTVSGDGFLLIAGPVDDPPKKHAIAVGDYAIYSWNEGAAEKRLDLQPYGKKTKPEALLLLDENAATARALLMFDGPKEGEPTPVEIPLQ
ncbi:DUF3616 domain-containing protein [Dongia sp.]|uniref:DUF3616 domain-containing protein n=1 Tax=Dongia sp. TaxID=1977262 RepID=UPI0037524688